MRILCRKSLKQTDIYKADAKQLVRTLGDDAPKGVKKFQLRNDRDTDSAREWNLIPLMFRASRLGSKCRLWVITGSPAWALECPLLGVKQKSILGD